MTPPALTVQDVATRYGVGLHTVLAWVRSGELRALNVGRKPGAKKPRWRITTEALEAFELRRSHTPPPTPARRRKRQPVIDYY